MKTIIYTTIIFICAAFNSIFAQSSSTLVKTIDNKGAVVVVANLQGKVTVKETDTKFVRITTSINATNIAEDMLQRLINAGRYTIQADVDANGNCTLTMPAIEKRVVIKGNDLVDVLSFEIEMPKGMSFQNKGTVADAPAM
jgi:uncharacterized protein (DUF2141 family)